MPLYTPHRGSGASHYFSSPTHSHSHQPQNEFFFRRRNGKLDWRSILSIDLERVVATVDVDTLQQHVEALTFADINEDDLYGQSDTAIVQMFRLAQLIIEYLLNVQNYLLHAQKSKQKTYEAVTIQLSRAKSVMIDKEDLIEKQKQEIKYLKKIIKAHETNGSKAMISQPSPGVGLMDGSDAHQCMYCRSSFINAVYLQSHIHRRHPDEQFTSKRSTSKFDDEEREREKERDHDRQRRDEIERERDELRKEFQRQKQELESERQKWEQEKEKQKDQLRHTVNRPPPIIVTPPQPAQPTGPVMTQEWLENYTKEIEKKVSEKTLAALNAIKQSDASNTTNQSHGGSQLDSINDKIARLHSRLESLIRGEIPLTPLPRNEEEDESQHMQRFQAKQSRLIEQTRVELLEEIKRLKRSLGISDNETSSGNYSVKVSVPRSTSPPKPKPVLSSPQPFTPRSHRTPSPNRPQMSDEQRKLTRVRSAATTHQEKLYPTFSAFPQLLSRYQHDERDLLASLQSFSELVDNMRTDRPDVAEGDESRWRSELIREQGYGEEEKQITQQSDQIVNYQYNGDRQLEHAWNDVLRREQQLEEKQRQRELSQAQAKQHQQQLAQERRDLAAQSPQYSDPVDTRKRQISFSNDHQFYSPQTTTAFASANAATELVDDQLFNPVSGRARSGTEPSQQFSIHRATSQLSQSPTSMRSDREFDDHDSMESSQPQDSRSAGQSMRDRLAAVEHDDEIESIDLPQSNQATPQQQPLSTHPMQASIDALKANNLSPLKRVGGGFAATTGNNKSLAPVVSSNPRAAISMTNGFSRPAPASTNEEKSFFNSSAEFSADDLEEEEF